ncbi:MAG: SpoIID/LytB domain-containing protein [Leptolyngbya sp. IPPAS B-1204]|nr:SpoIID/LytB domain-containing protein [Elainella sp. C42_A2020_010]RNJ70436.1 MAG: SpoIID/LytB domain-containing protein [Leptolyngbya sp. IPPAS B-1204]
MAKPQFVQFFKRYPWLLLLLLAVLQLAGVLIFLNLQRQSSSSAPSLSGSPASTPSPVSSLAAPVQPTSTPGKRATKTQAPPSATAPGSEQSTQPASPQPKPSLTAEQKAINERYKQSFVSPATAVDTLIEMRVAIAEGVPALSLGSSTSATLMDQDRKPLLTLSAETRYTAQPSGNGTALDGSQLPAVVLVEPSQNGLLYLGDRAYRGRLLLVNDAGKLWAVNLVNLRNYLHSVVASEVSPSWHPEALKAQAVAARSYALTYYFKPMSSLFHLGATEYYQVYSGINREAPETNQAVDATSGQFVSYRGGIVESLYAASDDIVAEAFQGHGMSQLGALNLAEEGYNYQQILANYYPGTGLGQIVQDYE